MSKKSLVVIAHNIRSTHNVGALLRTAEGLGVEHVYLTGYTPYPYRSGDSRLPHIAQKLHKQIHKTALGAEDTNLWLQADSVEETIGKLRNQSYVIAGLEQTPNSIMLPDFKAPEKLAIILGSEVEGMNNDLIKQADVCLEIPMFGTKESFNVVEAASMTLYHCTFMV